MGAEELRARPRRPGFPSKGAWPPGCSAEVMQVREAAFLAIMAIDRVIPVFGRLDEALTPRARSDLSG